MNPIYRTARVGDLDIHYDLADYAVPTLILSGAKSPIAQEAEVKAMQSRMPAAKLVAFEGYGHGVNMLAPERCVVEVRKFLAEQPVGLASGASHRVPVTRHRE